MLHVRPYVGQVCCLPSGRLVTIQRFSAHPGPPQWAMVYDLLERCWQGWVAVADLQPTYWPEEATS